MNCLLIISGSAEMVWFGLDFIIATHKLKLCAPKLKLWSFKNIVQWIDVVSGQLFHNHFDKNMYKFAKILIEMCVIEK